MRALPALLLCAAAAGCAPSGPVPSTDYHVTTAAPVSLAYAPGALRPLPPGEQSLRAFGAALPAGATPSFFADGPYAVGRLAVVSRALDRPVRLVPSPDQGDTRALLTAPSTGIVADSCRGPGARLPEDNWTWRDDRPERMLPPGCALATALAMQTTRRNDLLRGRALPPGPSLPYAQAIERYENRNAPRSSTDTASSGGESSGTSATVGGGSSGQAASGNPLLGGLPPASPAPQTQAAPNP